MVQWIDSFPLQSDLQDLYVEYACSSIRRLQRCMRIFANARCATGLPVLSSSGFARHCCWHRNFQLSQRMFYSFLEFLVRWNNEVNTSQFSCIIKLGFLDSPFGVLFSFWRFWHVFPFLWPKGVKPGCRLLPSVSPPGPCISIWWFFIQYGEPSKACPRIWQVGPHHRSHNRRCFSPVLHPVTYLLPWSRGIGNDAARHEQFDSRFNVMTVFVVSWNGFTIIRRWVLKKGWRRPVWFSQRIFMFFSSDWVILDYGGCSQNLVSSR